MTFPLLRDIVVGKKTKTFCRRCQRDTCHKLGRRGHWHCLVCGTERVTPKAGTEVKGGLPPGFLVEKHPDGRLGLYLATVLTSEASEKKVMHYLKGVFPRDTTRKEIESHAWSVYMTLTRESERG